MIVSSAKHQRIVNVPKAYLWRIMTDFKNVGTLLPPPIIDEVKCESNDIGSLILYLLYVLILKEKL